MSGARYRRSPHLLVEWEGRNTVLVHCDTLRRFAVDDRLLAVLSCLDGWTDPGEVESNGHVLDPGDWERLVAMGVIEQESESVADGPEAAALWTPFELAVHRRSNRGGARAAGVLASGKPPPVFKPRGGGYVTVLPEPDLTISISLGEALAGRRSVRAYAGRPLRLEELSTLLHHAARVRGVFCDGAYGECALHPYPSGGARSELEVYVVACDVDGLQPGVHHYDARQHELVAGRTRDEHQERLLRWVHTTTGDVLNRDPQLMLLITAVFPRVMWKYQGIGLSLVYKDTGALFQTLYLVATAMGLAPCALGGGEEAVNARWLGLDPLVESQVGVFLVGPRAEGNHASTASATRLDSTTASPERMAPPRQEPSPDRILRLSQGFLASAIVRTGLQLGVFDRLADGAANAEAFAAAADVDGRGARVLLDALAAVGLVRTTDGAYALSSAAERHLVSGRPGFVGGMVRAYADDLLWEALRRLPDAVRRGGTVLADHVEKARHPYWEQLAAALAEFGDPAPAAVATVLAPLLEGRSPLHVLDIACGNGAMAFALAQRDAAAEVWLLDWPDVAAVARRRVELLGLGERAHFITGDMMEVSLGGPYDLILVSQVLHNLDADRCRRLLRRAADALRPDGVLAVLDMVRAAPPREDPAPYLFSVITLAWTPGGDVRSLAEHETLLREAGLALRDVHSIPLAGTRLLIAERAAQTRGADVS